MHASRTARSLPSDTFDASVRGEPRRALAASFFADGACCLKVPVEIDGDPRPTHARLSPRASATHRARGGSLTTRTPRGSGRNRRPPPGLRSGEAVPRLAVRLAARRRPNALAFRQCMAPFDTNAIVTVWLPLQSVPPVDEGGSGLIFATDSHRDVARCTFGTVRRHNLHSRRTPAERSQAWRRAQSPYHRR